MPTPEIFVPAPADSEQRPFVHKVSGALVYSRAVAFKIVNDAAEPVWWPALDREQWAEITQKPSGHYAAWGKESMHIQSLCSAIREGRQPL